MSTLLFLLLGFGLVVLLIFFGSTDEQSRVVDHRRVAYFAGRRSISHAEFGESYFPTCPELAATLRGLMESVKGEDMSRVLPDDFVFSEYVTGDDLSEIEYIMCVEDHYRTTISDEEVVQVRTVREFVSLVQGLVEEDDGARLRDSISTDAAEGRQKT